MRPCIRRRTRTSSKRQHERASSLSRRPAGLFGGKSEYRTVVVIHRGQGTKWEVVFREHDVDVVTTTSTDLNATTDATLSWLRGGSLFASENSLHAAAG